MTRPPNILWIFSDQQPAYTLGCNGDPNSRTPNLDRLAGSGFNFRNAVSGYPLCCPFRGSLLTGEYPHCCVPGHEYQLPPEIPTAADYFNHAGYDTAYIGKWHLDGMKEKDIPRVGKEMIPYERRGRFGRWIGYENNNMQFDCYVHGHLDAETPVPLTRLPGYETDGLTNLMLDFLQDPKRKEKPFFAILSVQPPHNPYLAPSKYHRRYLPQKLQLRPNVAHNPSVEATVRQDLAGMYAMIENLDDNVGRILDCLYENNLDQNTWVFFFSDHGDMHGSHGQFKKTAPWQEAVNVPFIVWGGSAYRPLDHYSYADVNYLINHVDILPTSLGLAGIHVPAELPGFDYSSLFRGERPADPPQSAYLQNVIPTMHYDSIDRPYRGVITADGWKYVCTEEGDWLLFDLNSDPYEECNLAFNSRFQRKRKELRQMTADWITRTGDKFHFPYQENTGFSNS